MTTMPDVITAPQAERHNRRRKGYHLPGSYWDRVQRGPRNPQLPVLTPTTMVMCWPISQTSGVFASFFNPADSPVCRGRLISLAIAG